ncbi:DUF5789 family protein [Natrarchaeobius oligotrophus]|uniref:DUF2795 domain-containing protein n=1 Tax=Natrarchaeobius chitinivorans TaxID=1679083 RepID=A0A3N6MJF8_NATCH|nr:hypothetical protein [Natrarchaeobius chitinivorans]RQH01445.1 hypothetical protein EA472_08380 [Natrarchaeobius chitinivorans]
MDENEPDRNRAQDRAERRKSSRADRVESVLDDVERDLGELEYPVTSEEIATEYGNEPIDMPNETESLGSVFDRLAGEQFDDPEEVREAVYGEITGEAGDAREANPERDLERLDEEKQGSIGESAGDTL